MKTEPTYLCRAWGETDLPSAAIVQGLDAVRAFFIEQWLGEENPVDYDGTPTLPPIMEELAEREWRDEGAWNIEFEIGGVSVELVDACQPPFPMTGNQRGEIAYQLTKRLVIDMPTARAAVDAAVSAALASPCAIPTPLPGTPRKETP